MNPEISVIVPSYNEEEIIFESYKDIKHALDKLNQTYEIIFCNDGSTDKTLDILTAVKERDSSVKLISYLNNRGLAYAYKQLFSRATGEILIAMDADLAMRPEDTVPLFLTEIKNADIVVGSRYLDIKPIYPLYRLIPSKISLFMSQVFLGCHLSDINSGFFAIKKNVLRDIDLISNDIEICTELFVKAEKKGFKIKEVPLMYVHKTESGEISILKHGPKTFVGILRLWLKMKMP